MYITANFFTYFATNEHFFLTLRNINTLCYLGFIGTTWHDLAIITNKGGFQQKKVQQCLYVALWAQNSFAQYARPKSECYGVKKNLRPTKPKSGPAGRSKTAPIEIPTGGPH